MSDPTRLRRPRVKVAMIRNTSDAMAAAFRIDFVCTGNRFRSPLAAELLRRAIGGLPVEVASVGTLDLGPLSALPEAMEEWRPSGGVR